MSSQPHAHTAVGTPTANGWATELLQREGPFAVGLIAAFVVTALTFQTPAVAMWVGFGFAAYAATSNDSIQTIGTFLVSNAERAWWVLWAYIAAIFLLTVTWSWVVYDGDVSYGRLAAKGFETAPTSFSYLQVAAPLFLLALTRAKIPVSTTFLCLSGFAASASSIGAMVGKSVSGYGVAFVSAIVIWAVVQRLSDRLFAGEAHPAWLPFQWLTTGALWSVWLMQDAANVAVYLPRQLSGGEFAAFCAVMVAGLGLLFYLRGDRIQSVVSEKTAIVDVRAATLVDLVYAAILWYFKVVSNIPMSTTWVFVGLLAGREFAIAFVSRPASGSRWDGFRVAGLLAVKDLVAVTIGLVVSLGIAASVNAGIRQELAAFLGIWR